MRTITKEYKVYRFSELSEEAKRQAIEDYNADMPFHWSDEAMGSLKAGIKHFGCSLNDWSIDYLEPHRNRYTIDYSRYDKEEDLLEDIEGMGSYNPETLKGLGDCKFTGHYTDENFCDGVRKKYFDGERDIKELILAGIQEWETAVRIDAEYQYTEEFMNDTSEINDWEYTEDGSFNND